MSNSSWLDQHMEEFVRPVLGEIPAIPTAYSDDPEDDQFDPYTAVARFTPERIALLNTLWQKAKENAAKEGKSKILLPGRDAFLFEIIAKVEGFDATIFRPDMSSTVSSYCYSQPNFKLKAETTEWGASCYGIDSGYRGSVLNNLKVPKFGLVSYNSMGVYDATRGQLQLLPRMHPKISTSMCCDMECCPKYWTRAEIGGTVNNFTVKQALSSLPEFKAAAVLTQHVVKHLDPSLRIDVPDNLFDATLAGTKSEGQPKAVMVTPLNNSYDKGWFFYDDYSFMSYKCGGITGVLSPGCFKALKPGRWVLSAVFRSTYGSGNEGKSNGQVLCGRCLKKAGIEVPPELLAQTA